LARQAGAFSNTIERVRVRTRAVRRTLRGVEAMDSEQAERLLQTEAEEDLAEDGDAQEIKSEA
jgi:hypothetical protein